MTVTIVKDGTTQTTVTDRAGDFVFEPREPGRYTVSVDASDRYYVEEPVDNCRASRIRERVRMSIAMSRVTAASPDAWWTPRATPVSGLTHRRDQRAAWTRTSRGRITSSASITDSAGRYELRRLPAGRFIVGINIGGLRRVVERLAAARLSSRCHQRYTCDNGDGAGR